MDLNSASITRFVLGEKPVSLLIDLLLNINFLLLVGSAHISLEFVAWREAMFVLALVSTVRARPIPPVFFLFNSL